MASMSMVSSCGTGGADGDQPTMMASTARLKIIPALIHQELVHHSRKTGADVVQDGRGAVALLAAARSARVLNGMSEDEASQGGENFGKVNLAPPADKAAWFRFVSVALGNGDDVGVPTPWRFLIGSAALVASGAGLLSLRSHMLVASGAALLSLRSHMLVGSGAALLSLRSHMLVAVRLCRVRCVGRVRCRAFVLEVQYVGWVRCRAFVLGRVRCAGWVRCRAMRAGLRFYADAFNQIPCFTQLSIPTIALPLQSISISHNNNLQREHSAGREPPKVVKANRVDARRLQLAINERLSPGPS